MNILDNYIEGVKTSYINLNRREDWDKFVENRNKISNENIEELENRNVTKTLIELLKYTDGTDMEEIIFLGSDIDELGYFLESSNELLSPNRFSNEFFINMHRNNPDSIDNKLIPLEANEKWLHFANSYDNGRTSELYIDLNPSRFGTFGQIIRYRSEPSEFKVIASSFDKYLEILKEKNYNYIK